uniref:Uncharacterized protein n=1 Tax=Eutreptiella gymnastica TaxID=73025 RepID=A0A7S1HZP8_9EUGL|mmetsp:Transcript_116493/g.202640  ORF Transcript_116493/g.202640 Transcript_116493/m.202640 type:complete len:135 (+) Transcript_116493:323-727(+)
MAEYGRWQPQSPGTLWLSARPPSPSPSHPSAYPFLFGNYWCGFNPSRSHADQNKLPLCPCNAPTVGEHLRGLASDRVHTSVLRTVSNEDPISPPPPCTKPTPITHLYLYRDRCHTVPLQALLPRGSCSPVSKHL